MVSKILMTILAGALVASAPNSGTEIRPESAYVVFNADTIRAEVSDEYEERLAGLMGRDSLPDGTGMLFIFPGEAERSFWMKDTVIDLDIAFMTSGFQIIRIATMKAESSDLTSSDGPAMFALEVRAGWFAEKGIRVGDVPDVIFDPLPQGSLRESP